MVGLSLSKRWISVLRMHSAKVIISFSLMTPVEIREPNEWANFGRFRGFSFDCQIKLKVVFKHSKRFSFSLAYFSWMAAQTSLVSRSQNYLSKLLYLRLWVFWLMDAEERNDKFSSTHSSNRHSLFPKNLMNSLYLL